MSSAISKAVQEIKYRIPHEVLQRVFLEPVNGWRPVISMTLESQIENLVIRPRVLVDLNLVSGQEVMVPLAGLEMPQPQPYQTVIHVPKSRTNGRRINSVRNVSFFNMSAMGGIYGATAGFNGGLTGLNLEDSTTAVAVTAGLMASYDKIPQTSTAKVSLIAENTVLVNDAMIIPSSSFLRCILENDENLSSLPLRSYMAFCQLVEYAVKAFIHNRMVVAMGERELFYGQELGRFKEIVDSYADANQNYLDYLREKMQAIMLMSDEASYSRLIKMVVGGYR